MRVRPKPRRLGIFLFSLGLAIAPCLNALAQRVAIDGLDDMSLGVWRGFGDLEREEAHCVRTAPQGRYSVRLTGSGPGGAFVLNDSVLTLPYKVFYSDGAGFTQVEPGVVLSGLEGAGNTPEYRRCLNGATLPQRVSIRIAEQDLASARSGHYSGILSILIIPD